MCPQHETFFWDDFKCPQQETFFEIIFKCPLHETLFFEIISSVHNMRLSLR